MASSVLSHDELILERVFNPEIPLEGICPSMDGCVEFKVEGENVEAVARLRMAGLVNATNSEYDAALTCFSEAILLRADIPDLYNDRAQVYRLLHQNEEAMKDLDSCIGLGIRCRSVSNAFVQRAMLKMLMGEEDSAKQDYRQAASMNNTFAKKELARLNPYAALCGQMLHDMFAHCRDGKLFGYLMAGVIDLQILSARNLPVMDRQSDLTDAFVEIRIGSNHEVFKTSVVRKSLNPRWDKACFHFDVTDSQMMEDLMELKIMDHDTYSSHDAIGNVYINLRNLLCRGSESVNFVGWLPILDTIRGIRGELHLSLTYKPLSDFKSSGAVSSKNIIILTSAHAPIGYKVTVVGFVEELLVSNDPEYMFMNNIRTARTSNLMRQELFMNLGNKLQSKIATKVQDMNANAVLGFRQHYDLEGDSGIVVRGVGTAVILQKAHHFNTKDKPAPVAAEPAALSIAGGRISPYRISSPLRSVQQRVHRTSDNDESHSSGSHGSLFAPSIDMMEFPFFTLKSYPFGFIKKLGGIVTAHSIKLLKDLHENCDEPERDHWWSELRAEMRMHAQALSCQVIVGYTETVSICNGVAILSALGTAAQISASNDQDDSPPAQRPASQLSQSCDARTYKRMKSESDKKPDENENTAKSAAAPLSSSIENLLVIEKTQPPCSAVHAPYKQATVPVSIKLHLCRSCGAKYVPPVLFSTVPFSNQIVSQDVVTTLITAEATKNLRKDVKGEALAKEIGDILPFVEYALHRQLLSKVLLCGYNALINLSVTLEMNENMILMTATATGVHLSPLRTPLPPTTCNNDGSREQAALIQAAFRVRKLVNTSVDEIVEKDDELSVSKREVRFESEKMTHLLSDLTAEEQHLLCSFVPYLSLSNELLLKSEYEFVRMLTAMSRFRCEDFQEQSESFHKRISAFAAPSWNDQSSECEGGRIVSICVKPFSICNSKNVAHYLLCGCVVTKRSQKQLQDTPLSELPVTSLSYIPHHNIESFRGNINFFFIREQVASGGVSQFVQKVFFEAQSYLRSYAKFLGGDALLSFDISLCQILEQGSQCQVLVNIQCDIAKFSTDDYRLPPLAEPDTS